MKRLLAGLLIFASFGMVQAGNMVASMDDVLLLTQRGVSDETILVFLQSRVVNFIPDASDIDKLLEAGVSEEVIRYLLGQTTSTPSDTSTPLYIPTPVAYADPYPPYYYRPYYYTPYYARSSLFYGFPTFFYSSYGHRYRRAAHHNRPHHSGSVHLAHNGYGGHGVSHTGGHNPGHSIASVGHNIPSVGHSIASVAHNIPSAGHTIASAGHSQTGSIGHSRSAGHSSSGGHSSSHSGGGHSGGGHGGGH